VLNGLIQAEALYQEACRLGYDRDPAVKRDVVNRMLMKEVDSRVNIQDISDATWNSTTWPIPRSSRGSSR